VSLGLGEEGVRDLGCLSNLPFAMNETNFEAYPSLRLGEMKA
jgi:hypothetical protein